MTYNGRATKSGNSQAMAFEKSLFRTHPEFATGRLSADYIGPGCLLVRTLPDAVPAAEEDDPILGAYLAFLEAEIAAHPERMRPLSPGSLERARELVGHLYVDPNEDLGDGASID
jgi:antitoxin PrlF